jgi:hypothetical protein
VQELKKQMGEQKERLDILEAREKVWVDYSKQQEKQFADYKALTETRMDKMASLIAQLMAK